MNSTSKHNQRIAKITFASIYTHYIRKIEKKNRSQDELHKVIEWLTGFNSEQIEQNITFKIFLKKQL